MSDDPLVRLTLRSAQRTEKCVLAFEAAELSRPSTGGQGGNGYRPPIRAILLEDLHNESSADAVITIKTSSGALQKLTIFGYASAGTYKLGFKGQTTTAIPYNATAAQVQTALEKLSTIGANNVRVTIGTLFADAANTPPPLTYPGVWLIELVGVFLTRDPTTIPLLDVDYSQLGTTGPGLMITEHSQWADSGEIVEIHAILPVTDPTPLRAGAVCTAIHYPGLGYGLETIEPRQFGNPY